MPSSSSSTAKEKGSRHDDDNSGSSSSSNDSDSERESGRGARKRLKREEAKKLKKESKSRKEKKEKKEKKSKKEKKDRKRDKEERHNNSKGSYDNAPALSEHDAVEMASFRQAVQGKQILVANEREQASLINASREDIAASLGLPKGLIRTTVEDNSITQRYSRDLFGGDDDNPAKRQRLNRERIAKRALEIARTTLNAKADAERAAAADPAKKTLDTGLMNIMNRFSSSKKGIS